MNRPIPEKSLTTWLFNPFFYIAGWQALSYRSFSVSCNVKGGRAIGTFIAGVLLAEIISKAVIIVLFNIPLQQIAE